MNDANPEVIVGQQGPDPLGEWFLSLAVVFNDLKGLMWVREILQDGRPKDGEVSAYSAQWRGITLQITKLACGLVHELFELIKDHTHDLDSDEMKRVLKIVPKSTMKKWDSLIALARDAGSAPRTPLTRALLKIRHNVSFHYHQPKVLVAGYRRHFFQLKPGPHNKRAYYTIGGNMEETRFYYADAAVQQSLAILSEHVAQDFTKELSGVLRDVNLTLAQVIGAFVRQRVTMSV